MICYLSYITSPTLTPLTYTARSYLQRHQHAEELPLVADEAAVAEDGHLLHHLVLNEDRRNVLSSRCDDQLLSRGDSSPVRGDRTGYVSGGTVAGLAH